MIGQSIMLVGAHADDVELSAGGSVHKWRGQGRDVRVAILSADEAPLRHAESLAACMHLDVDHVYALGGRDKSLHHSIHALIEPVEHILHEHAVDTVFTHFHADTHQDHVSAYRIMAAAARKVPNFLMFKPTYPSGRTDIPFQPNVVSMLSAEDIDAKVQALDAFKSQRVKYGGDDWGRAMHAVAQGDAWTYAGVHGYAEVFQLGRIRI
ncbi:PIG-L deacetylase family protein [Variovorax rhizosphaerae]|uniref:PIG-L deacetylase family protein n=1 Tax=Variovorax rhizosphaerae TaxID=1836200 RepID=A0ABU8WZ65_9BURK